MWVKDLNVRPETIKLLEENTEKKAPWLWSWQQFFDMTPESASNKIKNKQEGQHQAKSFCTTKETISKMEWQPTEWEKIFANQLSDMGLIARMHKEGWTPKNWCFWTVVLEKTLESPLDCKEIKPLNPRKSIPSIYWKGWCWSWSSNSMATWCKELTH